MTLGQRLGKWSGVRRTSLAGVGAGFVYGMLARAAANADAYPALPLLTFSFLALVPLAVGYLAVVPADQPRLLYRLLVPWIPTTLAVVVTALVGWEGSICIVMSAPLILIVSSTGGLLAGVHARRRARGAAVVAVLPFLVAPVETALPRPERIDVNATQIRVAVPPEVVWQHVIEVPTITAVEQRRSLYRAIGFPQPVNAELIGSGVGAVRHARFAGNVLFVETISAWDEHRRIAFTIDAQTDSIPATTLDPHVTIGGAYFDVLTGEYLLESLPDGGALVVLTSTHRVSTTFNAYTALWARAIMKSVQRSILEVIKERAERSGSEPARAAPVSTH